MLRTVSRARHDIRRLIFTALLVTCAPAVGGDPIPEEQWPTSLADARHVTIGREAGKHGDIWSSQEADGRIASRMSASLRGWITAGEMAELILVDGDALRRASGKSDVRD